MADSWPVPSREPVSVALSPTADRLAMSVGQRLSVSMISDHLRCVPLLELACAPVPGLAWSPSGDRLAFLDDDGNGRLLDLSGRAPAVGEAIQMAALGAASAMAFAPDGGRLATLAPSLPNRMTLTMLGPGLVRVWERVLTWNRMSGNRSEGVNLAWSPDGRFLAFTTGTSKVWLIDASSGRPAGEFDGHSMPITGLCWHSDGRLLSASGDATLQVWHPHGASLPTVVETIPAAGMVFVREQDTALVWSHSGDLLSWSLADPPSQLWHRDPLSPTTATPIGRLAVSAVKGLLALVDAGASELLLVSDWDQTVGGPATTTTYANAKVLLLGDSGVGKSGLAMVLAGEEFRATESTHGRRIWALPGSEEPNVSDGDREVLIWDLAGQPGYRIVHQLHLAGAALALIIFDSKSETAPLAGVRHWARAVRHAHPVSAGGLTTFLVAARTDRGGVQISPERIQEMMNEFELDEYFETSAKEGTNTGLLRSRLMAAIDWERIPKIASTVLFRAVKGFVVDQKVSGNLLTPLDELCRAFQTTGSSSLGPLADGQAWDDLTGIHAPEASSVGLTSMFEGCVARLESAGLVKRLKFGDYVLLQPELLDAYASAMVNAARDDPDGLGSILETQVIEGEFLIPSMERVLDRRQERLLILATLEELIQSELVLREPTDFGIQLVFPAAHKRDLPGSEAPKGDGVVFRFQGPVANVFATLIVRLSRSNRFTRVAAWQSAARFAADVGECTVFLKSDGEGEGEFFVGYDGMPDIVRRQFEMFVYSHVIRWSVLGSVTRERQYCCPVDGSTFTREQVEQARNRGRDSVLCPVCENRVSLGDDFDPVISADHTGAMDASADAGREFAAATTILRAKEEVAEFDALLCHSKVDKPAVRELARRLRERGLRPWLDERELRPGISWQQALEEHIQHIPAAVVVVGSQAAPWDDQEQAAFLRQFVRRGCPVIPVLLAGAELPRLPTFLGGLTWVDLSLADPDPLDTIEWGITGRAPDR